MNPILNRALLSFALSSVQIGLSIWNPITQRFTWNKLQANLHDLDLNRFDGRLESFLASIHSDDVNALNCFFVNSPERQQDPPIHIYRVVHQNLSIHWIRVSTCWKSPSALFIVAQDITEERLLGTTVITQTWQQNFLFEEIAHIAFSLGGKHRISNCSKAAQSYLGIEHRNLLGRSVFDFVHSDDRDLVLHLIQNLNDQTQRLPNIRVHHNAEKSGWFEFFWFGSWRTKSGILLLKHQEHPILQTDYSNPMLVP
jgi:PAS domain-containing protein